MGSGSPAGALPQGWEPDRHRAYPGLLGADPVLLDACDWVANPLPRGDRPPHPARLVVAAGTPGVVRSARVEVPGETDVHVPGSRDVVVLSLLGGVVDPIDPSDSDARRVGAGDVLLANHPDVPADLRWQVRDASLLAVRLPASLVADVMGRRDDASRRPPRFTSCTAHGGLGPRWWHAASAVHALLAELGDAGSQLVVAPAARMLAATALACFPNDAVQVVPREPSRAGSATVRRAVSYIESHPDVDLTTQQVADAAFVTPRALQMAFRRQLDTTPTAYLRGVRLAQADDELRSAEPGDGRSVTSIAHRWGFTSSSFSRHYRAAYGRAPSEVLRTTVIVPVPVPRGVEVDAPQR
ncbi:hypothetical protein GCM10027270_16760 [Nocardioides ginkgobilobae]